MIQTINPATEQPIKNYGYMNTAEVEKILQAVDARYQQWKKTSLTERSQLMHNLAEILLKHQQELAHLITEEMGKPISQSLGEVKKCSFLCRYYAECAKDYLQPTQFTYKNFLAEGYYQPIGTIFAMMPWNFPLWQVLRFLVPTLMLGNTAVLRHAPIVTELALRIEQLIQAAGYPEDVFRVLLIDHDQAALVIAHDTIKGVTLTGSERAGKAIAQAAGAALKKVVLEMGGSDPYIILADADLELAAQACVDARLNTTGQVCIAAKRLIAVKEVYEDFKRLVLAKAQAYQMGDPLDKSCMLGPLARADLRETLHQQIQESLAQGATLLCGGEIPQRTGFYYPVTALENITPNMPAYDDELFGPVLTFIAVSGEEQAIKVANDTRFGLSASVFSRDEEHAKHILLAELNVGCGAINNMVISHPAAPFGGTKASGIGREMGGEGMREFANFKTLTLHYAMD